MASEPNPHNKALYIITHADLTSGEQTAQVAHAVADFCLQNPQLAKRWHLESEYIIVLEAPNQQALEQLRTTAYERDLGYTSYEEPDMGDTITALVLHPGVATRKLVSNLPCAGRKQRKQLALATGE